MIKRRCLLLVSVFLIIIIIVAGCKIKEQTEEEIYSDFQQKILDMNSYTCRADIVAINNKSESTYVMNHTYKKPNYYKLEILSPENLKGKTMEYYKDKIVIKNKKINDVIELPNVGENKQYLFIGDFIQNYFQNESIDINFTDKYLVLDVKIAGEKKYFNKQILYVNKKTKNPEKMEILDKEGNKKFIVKYTNFECKD